MHLNRELKILYSFAFGWLIINLLQANFTGLEADEAYYWTFSRELSWGYFDHPPVVALSIWLGELFGHGPLFTRLGTVLLSTGTIIIGYFALPENIRRAGLYCLVVASVAVFQPYGFIVTPDAGLLFFTACFFYSYRLFLNSDSFNNIILVSLSIIGLLYSKYHGVLPVFFTLISNPGLFKRKSVWVIFSLVIIGMLPHAWWQYNHDWASIRYHLLERIASKYKIEKTSNYIIGQLFIWGLLTTIPALYWIVRRKTNDLYLRAHQFTFWGILIVFLIMSFRSSIEPHWTLAAGISFVVLLQYTLANGTKKWQDLFRVLAIINITLLLAARLFVAIPGKAIAKLGAMKTMIHGRAWADSMHNISNGKPLVFISTYSYPALYQYYYPNDISTGYNVWRYRKNQFNISGDEEKLNNKEVTLAWIYRVPEATDSVNAVLIKTFIAPFKSFKSVNRLYINWNNSITRFEGGKEYVASISLENKSTQPIHTDGLRVSYVFYKTKKEQLPGAFSIAMPDSILQPGYRKVLQIPIKFPPEKHNYTLMFSIMQESIEGSFASPFYKVKVY